jgi:hypothetical protein
VASFVSCDRGCLPVLTALSVSEPGPVFAGIDRSDNPSPVQAGRTHCGYPPPGWIHNPAVPGLWATPEWMICPQPLRVVVPTASRTESAI